MKLLHFAIVLLRGRAVSWELHFSAMFVWVLRSVSCVASGATATTCCGYCGFVVLGEGETWSCDVNYELTKGGAPLFYGRAFDASRV
jgi:uncharacterized membrane protein